MTFGVTPAGFSQKRLSDVLSEAETNLALIQDPDSGEFLQPDFDSADPAMQIVKVPLEGVGAAWEALSVVYSQFDRNKATQAALRSLVQLNGIEWRDGNASVCDITVSGTPSTIVAAGSQITDPSRSMTWQIQSNITIGGGGTGSGVAFSVIKGPYNAVAGSLTVILTNIAGWSSVTNADAAIPGTLPESDTVLRRRQSNSTMAPASAPAEAIYSNLLNLDGVIYARVYVNNTRVADSRGLPGKNVAAVVQGGDEVEIAKVLLARTDMSDWYGNTAVVLRDLQGEGYAVRFIRPTQKNIYVEIDTIADGSFPADGVAQIKQAILDYAIGGAEALGITDGFEPSGFVPGSTVLQPRIYTPANFVRGHRITRLQIGVAPGVVSDDDITTNYDELAVFDEDNILVTVA